MMKKLTAAVFALMVLFCALTGSASADALSDIQAKGQLIVGASVGFPPYEFYYTDPETGAEAAAGFDMKLAQGIADQLGVELVIADQTFAGLITALTAGEIDLIISGMSCKPERAEVIDFSTPYYGGTQVLVVRAADAGTLNSVEAMAGKTVGAQMGSLQATILEEQFADAVPYVIDNPSVLAMDLEQGNIDGWLVADLVAKQYITVYQNAVPLAISDAPVVYDAQYGAAVGAAKSPENDKTYNASLLKIINDYIAQIKADGTFDAWVDESCEQAASLLAE